MDKESLLTAVRIVERYFSLGYILKCDLCDDLIWDIAVAIKEARHPRMPDSVLLFKTLADVEHQFGPNVLSNND